MTNPKPTPYARVALRGEIPRDLIWLLPLVNLNPFGAGGLDADFVAAFTRCARGGWSLSLRTGATATTTDRGFVCDSAYVAATFLLSRALGLREPFLTASEESFATLRKALAFAAGAANIVIEGETGAGKRSLAELLHRAGRPCGALARVNCAVPEEVARELASLTYGRIAGGAGRSVLLERIDELPLAHQVALAGAIDANGDAVRYFATSKVAIAKAVERGAFAPVLARHFDATLRLPPIHRRRADLVTLARYFLRNANPLLEFDDGALAALRTHRFGGNLRELHNLTTRLEIYETGESTRTISAARVVSLLGADAAALPGADVAAPPVQAPALHRPRARLRLVASAGAVRRSDDERFNSNARL
ncbi:MAG: sigma 54-interacting transcriptional regulator [Candidatus Binataceae bacterium]